MIVVKPRLVGGDECTLSNDDWITGHGCNVNDWTVLAFDSITMAECSNSVDKVYLVSAFPLGK